MTTALAVTVAYLVGSVPFAFLVSRRRGIDLRRVGSGNVGASNVLRSSGVWMAVVAMLLDAVKGACAVLFAERMTTGSIAPVAAGLASVVGHVFPVWLRFRGGKGVATAAGVFAILTPFALAMATAAFLVIVTLTRYISIGSIAAAITLVTVTALTEVPGAVVLGAALAAAIVVPRHWANLVRVWAGTERRVGDRL